MTDLPACCPSPNQSRGSISLKIELFEMISAPKGGQPRRQAWRSKRGKEWGEEEPGAKEGEKKAREMIAIATGRATNTTVQTGPAFPLWPPVARASVGIIVARPMGLSSSSGGRQRGRQILKGGLEGISNTKEPNFLLIGPRMLPNLTQQRKFTHYY